MKTDIVVPHDALARFSQSLLEAVGIDKSKASLVVGSVISGNLRGVDSHGVQLLPAYIERMMAGDIDIHADGHVVSENGSAMVYDGEHAIGQVVATACCEHVLRLARPNGFGMVVARESSHFGTCAYWAQKIADEGFIGIVMCNASPSVAPWQGRELRYGTNPICMSVPAGGKGAWLLDMATTTVARGKIKKAVIAGTPIPAGWALDREGRPTTSPEEAMQGLPMPLGGYKGTGLAVMVEILCAVLSGGGMLTDLGGIWLKDRPLRVSQMFAAIDVSRFMPLDEFQQRMERLVQELKSTKPATGYDEVLVAGDPEWRYEAERLKTGIPVEAGVWKKLVELAGEFHVELPENSQSR